MRLRIEVENLQQTEKSLHQKLLEYVTETTIAYWMRACAYVYMCMCVHVCACACMYVCACICMCVCMYMCVHIYTRYKNFSLRKLCAVHTCIASSCDEIIIQL